MKTHGLYCPIDSKCVYLDTHNIIPSVDRYKLRPVQCVHTDTGCLKVISHRPGCGEYIQLYCVNNHDNKATDNYKQSLYSDDDAEHERCTAKATMYTVNLIAGLIGKAMKDIINEDKYTKLVLWDVKNNCYEGYITK